MFLGTLLNFVIEMLGEEEGKEQPAVPSRKPYLRSVSWAGRSPSTSDQKPHPNSNRPRTGLPPLAITRRPVEEWPRAGSDDLGVWPNPQTPRGGGGSVNPLGNSTEFQFKKDKLAFFDKECSRIADHIYLGSDAVAKNREILQQNGITHVLNCVGFVCPEYFKNDLVYKTLWLQDSPAEDITSILYDVFDYFEDVREQGGRVFVHCFQGVSRSASLVIAYLMWREGQSFEDAFQYVKAARGVTNPNMGFACQLLQCQKRVHAVPASPNSLLRIHRMAPHSPYDSLHLVPKVLSHPSAQGLDSRGAFLVHVPSAIYAWIGRSCCSVMSNKAVVAANQVIRYERANGPCVIINEGNEPAEFWAALTDSQHGPDARAAEEVSNNSLQFQKNEVEPVVQVGIGQRRVDDYNLDFELFERALAGGVVPPFSVSHADSETCLPAREHGWGRLRQKFASGIMKEFVNSAKWGSDKMVANDCYDMVVDANKDMVDCTTQDDLYAPSSPLIEQCGSPDSSNRFPDTIHEGMEYPCKEDEYSVSVGDHLSPVMSPCSSPDSFSCFTSSSPKFSSKSTTLSPSNSDYASSFSFSPSSSNWSDLSYLSSQQPSPSGLESTDPYTDKNTCLYAEIPSSPKKMTGNQTLRLENISLPYKRTSPSIAERRGSNPPPRMFLSSVDEPSSVRRTLVRSCSFSLPDLDEDDVMKDADSRPLVPGDNREELMLDIETVDSRKPSPSESDDNKEYAESQLQSKDVINKDSEVRCSALYQWPTFKKVEVHSSHILDSRLAYMLLVPALETETINSSVLYIWLGREIMHRKVQNHLASSNESCQANILQWERRGRRFLNQMGLPEHGSVQVVSEGEEPDAFLNQVSSFLCPKGCSEVRHSGQS